MTKQTSELSVAAYAIHNKISGNVLHHVFSSRKEAAESVLGRSGKFEVCEVEISFFELGQSNA